MPPKSEVKDVEIKDRISKDLLKRNTAFWHQQELKNQKATVAALLEQGLSERQRTETELNHLR
jgi:hypothetical protein